MFELSNNRDSLTTILLTNDTLPSVDLLQTISSQRVVEPAMYIAAIKRQAEHLDAAD